MTLRHTETIAEIGAGDGLNILDLSLLADSSTFYFQDIDSETLSEKRFNKLCAKANKIKSANTNNYFRVIGTTESSELPDNTFDKIILVMTFHEFGSMKEMLSDIHRKLKPFGKLYIMEARCMKEDHKYYDRKELVTILESSNYKQERIDGKDYFRSRDLYRSIFSKIEEEK